MRSGYDVVVVGGGLVGTSLAYELACRGAAVALLDRADPGRASDAGAGILSPETTWRTDAVWFPFAAEAGAHYPGLVERLAGDGAPDPGYARTGLLSVSLSEGDEPWFENLARHALERAPDDVAEVPVTEARGRLPVLGHLRRALFNRAAARIDGRALTASLRHGCGARGVEVLAAGALGLDTSGDRATGVRTAEGAVAADAVVVAAGAWTPAVAEWLSVPLPVRPVKGQIVHLRVDDPARDPGNWPIAQPVLGHYLVPWPDRRVACGGTFEDRQAFDPRPTAAGTHELLPRVPQARPGPGRGRADRGARRFPSLHARRPAAAGTGTGVAERPRRHRPRCRGAAGRALQRRRGGGRGARRRALAHRRRPPGARGLLPRPPPGVTAPTVHRTGPGRAPRPGPGTGGSRRW